MNDEQETAAPATTEAPRDEREPSVPPSTPDQTTTEPPASDDPMTTCAAARRREFEEVVVPRRVAADLPPDADRAPWALALSGGGVRSATFCLGLLRGLAKNGLLRRMDYLSTVSGGGYVGSSLGRLYGKAMSAAAVERGVADDSSLWLWWLRNNGRYLTPAGIRDLGYAGASILRGVLATHGEIGVLLLLLSALIVAPHVVVSALPPAPGAATPTTVEETVQDTPAAPLALIAPAASTTPSTETTATKTFAERFAEFDLRAASRDVVKRIWTVDFVGSLGSVWWWLLAIPVTLAWHQLMASWFVRTPKRYSGGIAIAATVVVSPLLSLALALAGVDALHRKLGTTFHPSVFWVGAVALAVLPLAIVLGTLERRRIGAKAANLRRTKALATALWLSAAVAAIALLDQASWELTRWYWDKKRDSSGLAWAGAGAVLLAAGRLALPQLQKWLASTKGPSLNVERLLNFLGLVVAVLLALFWLTLLNVYVFRRSVWDSPDQSLPLIALTVIFLALLLYLLLTASNVSLLNRASLHHFYRARIERAYVSSGNYRPKADAGGTAAAPGRSDEPVFRFPKHPLLTATRQDTSDVARLMETSEGDDIALDAYAPHLAGGPIHLINCCVNQSVDDRTGVYNADRKGVALTVSPLGPETGATFPESGFAAHPPGSLSRWIAVSGAAVSTGMGSRTSPGLAGLLFMSGLRLGYWMQAMVAPVAKVESGFTALMRRFTKPMAIVAESLARFPGFRSGVWYVSDGGHFDNTGLYALLKRRPALVIAADCGADPNYLFSDLESLVRKATIDYGARIEFIDPTTLGSCLSPELAACLGTPESIGPEAGPNWLVLGRILYAREPGDVETPVGTLLLVKPRRLDRMPFDMVAYADRNPEFPQQTTGDQFFDESQWEAYHQLGVLAGSALTEQMVRHALAVVSTNADHKSTSSLTGLEAAQRVQLPPKSRRERMQLGIQVSVLGAGTLSLLLAAWQGFEKHRDTMQVHEAAYEARHKDLLTQITGSDFASIVEADFEGFAAESRARNDGRMDMLRRRLGRRCNELDTIVGAGRSVAPTVVGSINVVGGESKSETGRVAAPSSDAKSAREGDGEKSGTPFPSTVESVVVAKESVERCRSLFVEFSEPPPQYQYWFQDSARSIEWNRERPTSAAAVVAEDQAGPDAGPTMDPADVGTPESAAAASAPPAPVGRCVVDNQPIAVYLHVYDEMSEEAANQMARDVLTTGASTAVENVARTARRSGRTMPYVWEQRTLIYHSAVPDACRNALAELVPDARERSLPATLNDAPGTVEIWLPPRTAAPPAKK